VLLNTSRPAVALSPASLGFGSQTLNTTSAPKGVVVANSGDNRLGISDVRIVGTHQLDFEITKDECEGATIVVGDGCVVRVAFTPSAAGARSASLRITDNAPGSPHAVPLTGTGARPQCAGVSATIVGTPGSDTLTGTAGNDVVALLAGDDTFSGGGGSDSVCAGTGSDDVVGGAGNDVLRAQDGDDELRGSLNNDTLLGGSGDDNLNGGTQTDTCNGGSDIDTAAACETVTNVP
jgi:Ca2+-binding RTX toxin-like protein